MAFRLDLRSIANGMAYFVDEDPVQLRRVVADGGDESFASATPVLLGIGKKVAGERMAWEALDTGRGCA